ncbi:hypothetical protein NBO_2g0041 [Nosema bombycis CQ1]|uniref:Uncharacterized protein n=1 Tax=Nosema bombycis (strain CQ1 / CVCC 102059) TaxID=578461 RepID=R0MC52_NOSB1|nr:hypothetical protein NBO_2g0041 [Nosema bombycis CQ1]|eukprot:EOB15549.1 hypothetical protein NBO_2g0041 [Nosema bombycis CQ1]
MQLFNILSELDNVYRRLIFDLINKNEKICRRFCIDEIKDTFNGYIDGILERYLNGGLPEYSIYLLAKTIAKILLNISNNLDIFSNTCEYIKSVILLKIKLKIAFEEKNFNEKSIRTLQMICLEWDIFIGNKWHL